MRWRSGCCRAAAARCSASTCSGSREQGKAFIEALKLFSHLANVGDCRSLVIHPAITTHFRMDDAALAQAGITPGHDPPVDRPGGSRRPDRRPEARAEGRAEGGMKLGVDGPTAGAGLRLHRRQAASTPACPASSSSTARCTTTASGPCWRAGSRTTAMRVLALDLPGHCSSAGAAARERRGDRRLAARACSTPPASTRPRWSATAWAR